MAATKLIIILLPLLLWVTTCSSVEGARPVRSIPAGEYRFRPQGILNFLLNNFRPHRLLLPNHRRPLKLVRSTAVTVENESTKVFHLANTNCTYGGYSKFPPHEVPPNGTVDYSLEDNSLFYGIECITRYEGDDAKRTWLEMYVLNPVVGDNEANATHSDDIDVVTTVGAGVNNQVRFLIRPVKD